MFESLLTAGAVQSYLYFAAIVIAPLMVCFNRAGFSPWGALAVILPYSGLFLVLGFLAFKRWPNEPAGAKKIKSGAA